MRGHSAASASAATAAANPLDPLTADEIQRTFVTIKTARNLAPATFMTMDTNKLKVVDFVDSGTRAVDTTTSGRSTTQRTGLKPLVVQQRDGPSFTLDGRDVSWQGSHFRVDGSPREGLVLDRIGYEQSGVVRSIINRMSLSEIYVPHANPDANWLWRSAFDIGEYNLGLSTLGRDKNIDVPENSVFDDVAGDTGSGGGSFEVPGRTQSASRRHTSSSARTRASRTRARRTRRSSRRRSRSTRSG